MNNKFAVFIPSHGRADNVKTVKTLQACGYTGKIYIVIDDKDKQLQQYLDNFGDNIIIFSKDEASKYTDSYDSKPKMKSVLYARNFITRNAKLMGLDNFLVLDDDYGGFYHMYNSRVEFGHWRCKDLDSVFQYMCEFLNNSICTCIAFAQGGDFQGGGANPYVNSLNSKRKVMNSFFCSTKKPFDFYGEMNDDVNTYIRLGNKGHLFLTIPWFAIVQAETQKTSGGLTDMYLERGTYVKSFHSVVTCPSAVKVGIIGNSNARIHHKILRNLCVPKIIDEKYSK